ncbi:unnamed protein product [Prunus brigantina]
MGDFNDILDASEKVGGVTRTVRSMLDFRTFGTNNKLLDLGFMGYPLTWRNRRLDGGIQERLDRGLATNQWIYLYLDAKIHHLMVAGSNHVMLLLQTQDVGNLFVALGVCKWSLNFNRSEKESFIGAEASGRTQEFVLRTPRRFMHSLLGF